MVTRDQLLYDLSMGSKPRWQSNIPLTLQGMKPYTPHQLDCPIKLHANESPYDLPPELKDELFSRLKQVKLNRYPDSQSNRLRRLISTSHGVAPEQIVLGNGSDELISLIVQSFAGQSRTSDASIIFPAPTFSVYGMAAKANQCASIVHATDWNFRLDEKEFTAHVKRYRPNVCFFALPNNPTGTLWRPHYLVELAKRFPEMIVVSDEAYFAFSGVTNEKYVSSDIPNLIVLRTLSKVGLASLRVGYAICSAEVAEVVNAVRPPYNIGALNQVTACFALERAKDWTAKTCKLIVEERKRMHKVLQSLDYLTPMPSEANLILLRVGGSRPAKDYNEYSLSLWHHLIGRGILVRKFGTQPRGVGRTDNAEWLPMRLLGTLRATIGTRVENDALLRAIAEWSSLRGETSRSM